MKKGFTLRNTLVLTVLLFLIGCQKQIQEKEETLVANENSLQVENRDDKSECQLKHVDYGTGFTLDFKYNNKGLASEVLLSYSDGYFEQHKIFYDRKDRLVRTKITSLDLPVINYTFFYTGDNITRATGYFEGTNELWRDLFYSYNRKGQMTKLDDVAQDLHMRYFYNSDGYNTHGKFYLGSDLYYTYDYGFNTSNRNPFLAVNGVPFGFWDFFLPLWDKRWEDNDKLVLFEEGSPIVLLDTDPKKSRMTTGPHKYLTSATKYDRISESYYTEAMTYQNCGGKHDDDMDAVAATPASLRQPLSPVNKLRRILTAPGKEIKTKMKELIKQYK
jgi:hypothetical protein